MVLPDTGDPRLDWGPGEWHEEVQRVEAERDRYRAALEAIAKEARVAIVADCDPMWRRVGQIIEEATGGN